MLQYLSGGRAQVTCREVWVREEANSELLWSSHKCCSRGSEGGVGRQVGRNHLLSHQVSLCAWHRAPKILWAGLLDSPTIILFSPSHKGLFSTYEKCWYLKLWIFCLIYLMCAAVSSWNVWCSSDYWGAGLSHPFSIQAYQQCVLHFRVHRRTKAFCGGDVSVRLWQPSALSERRGTPDPLLERTGGMTLLSAARQWIFGCAQPHLELWGTCWRQLSSAGTWPSTGGREWGTAPAPPAGAGAAVKGLWKTPEQLRGPSGPRSALWATRVGVEEDESAGKRSQKNSSHLIKLIWIISRQKKNV